MTKLLKTGSIAMLIAAIIFNYFDKNMVGTVLMCLAILISILIKKNE